MKVCLDPGHGGRDPGAVAGGLREKDVALRLALRAKEALPAAGHQVIWTRHTDVFIPINDRAKIARDAGCDLFLSLHCNAAASAQARGVESLVVRGDRRSFELARNILHTWRGLDPRVVFRPTIVLERPATGAGSLGVLRGTYGQMPAILIEAGFLTNAADRSLMQDVEYGLSLGRAIVRAVG